MLDVLLGVLPKKAESVVDLVFGPVLRFCFIKKKKKKKMCVGGGV